MEYKHIMYIRRVRKKKNNNCYNLNKKNCSQFFNQIWQVAAAINAEQCMLKLSTSPGLCTHSAL